MKKIVFKSFLFFSCFLLCYFILYPVFLKTKDKILVSSYLKEPVRNDYKNYKVLSIPTINLKNVVVKAEKDFSNLNKSLVYLNEFSPYDKMIIFGHSGMGVGTYFNRLNLIKIGDEATIQSGFKVYAYKVFRIYTVGSKDVKILNEEKGSSKLLLITCDRKNKEKRLVVELLLKYVKTLKK